MHNTHTVEVYVPTGTKDLTSQSVMKQSKFDTWCNRGEVPTHPLPHTPPHRSTDADAPSSEATPARAPGGRDAVLQASGGGGEVGGKGVGGGPGWVYTSCSPCWRPVAVEYGRGAKRTRR